tara:strand:- start:2625 stop:3821 length:1197 start_codon:yes stop_codon:yes gene_type:complete
MEGWKKKTARPMAQKKKPIVENVHKVAVITSSTKTLLTFRYDFLKALKATGAEVMVLGPDDKTKKIVVRKLKDIDVSFSIIPIANTKLNPFQDYKTYKAIKSILKKQQVTSVFSYTLKPVIYGSLAAKAAGVKTITSMMTGLGHLYTFHDWRTKLLRLVSDRLLRIAFKVNATVFFQNKDDAQVLLDRNLLPLDKVVLVNGSGVNLKEFPKTQLPQQTPLTFLFVGRLLKSKGFYEYCEAVKMVHKKYPGMRYQVLGGHHPNPAQLSEKEARQIMKESGVDYLGETDDVLPFVQKAHVVVLPSYREGTPKALLEALSVGRPLITTNAPGCCETVSEKENGVLVHVADPWAIAEAMKFFITHPENILPMAKASRKLAEDKFDVHKVNATLIKHLNLEGN